MTKVRLGFVLLRKPLEQLKVGTFSSFQYAALAAAGYNVAAVQQAQQQQQQQQHPQSAGASGSASNAVTAASLNGDMTTAMQQAGEDKN